MSLTGQLVLLAGCVFLVGTPHGALDGRVAREALGRGWLAPFLAFYLLAEGAAVALWLTAPGLALAGFLLLATVHFGGHDARSGRVVAIATRGALVPVVASAAHPVEMTQIFGWISGEAGAALVPWLRGAGLLLWSGGAAATLVIERDPAARLELVGLALAAATAPPLVTFALYFALIHTPRALLASRRAGERWSELLRDALPFSVGAVALAAAGFLLMRGELADEPALVRTIFWWLGALTVPHMLLPVLLSRRNSPRAAGRSWPASRRPAAGG